MPTKDFILASASPQRKALLEEIGYLPKAIVPASINEDVKKDETPTTYIRRVAKEKAEAVKKEHPGENILSADTIIVSGCRIIRKSKNADEQRKVIKTLSGHAHKVITSVYLIRKDGSHCQKTVTTRIVMKNLSPQEIEEYLASKEWEGVAGYRIEGMLQGYVKKIIGSYSGVIGLPLYEAKNMLNSAGIY